MKKKIFLITTSLITQLGFAQVLLSEDFNSYATGHLNTDYTGTTAGQGGWVTQRHANAAATAMVVTETGKGNVLTITTTGTYSNEYVSIRQNTSVINGLWNNRATGNNVLKLEYDVYCTGFLIADGGFLNNDGTWLMAMSFVASTQHRITSRGSVTVNTILKNYTAPTFPYNTWHKVELFIDYTTLKAYFYIPTLNLFRADAIYPNQNRTLDNILFEGNGLKPTTSVVKFDNFKLSALQTVPAYILSANEVVSAKFNMYPNPATNVVNITNSENMLVEQVMVYDITGKQLTTQSFNNQTEIQLNVEDLANGTYMLHIQTNAGLAVKKLVKK